VKQVSASTIPPPNIALSVPGGMGPPGPPGITVYAFPFTFDTPGLATGIPITAWTPVVGETLIVSGIVVHIGWDTADPNGMGAALVAGASDWSTARNIHVTDLTSPAVLAGGLAGYASGAPWAVITPGEMVTLIANDDSWIDGIDPGDNTQGSATAYLHVASP